MKRKQQHYLRCLAMEIDPIFQIGKDGLGPNLIAQLDDALEARELIKISILQNSAETPAVAGASLARTLKAEVVQTIGRKIILYRRSEKKPKIELPR